MDRVVLGGVVLGGVVSGICLVLSSRMRILLAALVLSCFAAAIASAQKEAVEPPGPEDMARIRGYQALSLFRVFNDTCVRAAGQPEVIGQRLRAAKFTDLSQAAGRALFREEVRAFGARTGYGRVIIALASGNRCIGIGDNVSGEVTLRLLREMLAEVPRHAPRSTVLPEHEDRVGSGSGQLIRHIFGIRAERREGGLMIVLYRPADPRGPSGGQLRLLAAPARF